MVLSEHGFARKWCRKKTHRLSKVQEKTCLVSRPQCSLLAKLCHLVPAFCKTNLPGITLFLAEILQGSRGCWTLLFPSIYLLALEFYCQYLCSLDVFEPWESLCSGGCLCSAVPSVHESFVHCESDEGIRASHGVASLINDSGGQNQFFISF